MNKKNSLTTIISLIATVVAVMLLGGITVFADEVTYPIEGSFGSNITWTLDADGNLTVSGSGAMGSTNYPWLDYSSSIKTVTIEEGITSIEMSAFSSCGNLTKVTVPDSVKSIGYAAFAGDSNLSEINLPDSITSIGMYAFTSTALKNVTLPSNLQILTSNLFAGCNSLEYVYIPDSVTEIQQGVFSGSSIKSVRFPSGLTYIPKSMFATSAIETIELPSTITEIRENAFYNCHLKSITLPEGVVKLEDRAFGFDSYLETVVLPSTLEYIGNEAFCRTYKLEKITIPGSVKEIGKSAFELSGIKSLAFIEGGSNDSTQIGSKAFASCNRLKIINFSSTISSVEDDAFNGCSTVDGIVFDFAPDKITWDFSGISSSFKANKQAICNVPTEYLDNYMSAFANANVTFKGDREDVGIGEVLSGYSLSLEGDIGVNFYLRFNNVDSLSNDAKMLFTISSIDGQNTKTCEVYVKPQSDPARAVASQKNGYYVFKCLVNAKEMTSIITAQIVDGEEKGSAYTYTVQDYAKYMLSRPAQYEKEQELIKAMLNYGCACQNYFDYNLSNPANKILSPADQDYDFLPAGSINAGPEPTDLAIQGTNIKIAKASLVLNTTSVIKLFITGADENTVFKDANGVLTPIKSGEYYIIRIEGITAQNIKMKFSFRVYDGNKLLGTLGYSPLYYFKIVLDSDIDPNGPITYHLKVLVSMMYKYGDAALKYHPMSAN